MLKHFSEEELKEAIEATAPPPPRHVLDEEGEYVPFHLGQNKTWDSQRRITAMCAGTQSGKCLAPDSLVPLADGRRVRVDRVEAGDVVFSLGSNLKVQPAAVTASFGVGTQHLYKIITASGRSISVTREHPLLSPGGWRESQEFSIGDFVGVPRTLPAREGSGVYWDQVTEVVPLGEFDAWDLTIEGTANFVTEGFFAHNTVFGPWWLKRKIDQLGGGDYLAVTATFGLFDMKMLPEMLRVFEERLGIGRYWGGSKRVIELSDPTTGQFWAKRSSDPMWGRIILRSADSKGGLEAATAKAAWLDEAGQDRFRLHAWQAIRRRLSIHRGDILISTTLFNLGWLKTTIIDPAKDGGDVDLEVLDNGAEVEVTDNEKANIRLVQFDSIANPIFSVQEYREAEATMPSDDFFMFYRGRVARLRTMIYDCFDEVVNKVDSFPIPARWPKAVGVDPLGAETAAIWVALDPDKVQVHVYREYLAPFGETTRGHVENILEVSKNEIIGIWAGGGPSERQSRTDWTAAGIRLFDPPNIGVWPAILRVYELMKPGQLVIHKSCVHLLDEIGSYQRDRDKDGSLTDRIKDKSKYHLLDALRYIISLVTEPVPDDEVKYMDVPRVNVGY